MTTCQHCHGDGLIRDPESKLYSDPRTIRQTYPACCTCPAGEYIRPTWEELPEDAC